MNEQKEEADCTENRLTRSEKTAEESGDQDCFDVLSGSAADVKQSKQTVGDHKDDPTTEHLTGKGIDQTTGEMSEHKVDEPDRKGWTDLRGAQRRGPNPKPRT
jgi:hypothetical protein